MATQNHNPSATIMSSKNGRVNEGAPVDGHSVTKRLRHELMTLMTSGDQSVSAFPDGDNIFNWLGTVTGGKGTAIVYALSMHNILCCSRVFAIRKVLLTLPSLTLPLTTNANGQNIRIHTVAPMCVWCRRSMMVLSITDGGIGSNIYDGGFRRKPKRLNQVSCRIAFRRDFQSHTYLLPKPIGGDLRSPLLT